MSDEKTKAEQFKKLAKTRTATAIKRLRLLGQCANTQSYEYTEDQVAQIMAAIDDEVEKVKDLFAGKKPKVDDLFDFDEIPPVVDD